MVTFSLVLKLVWLPAIYHSTFAVHVIWILHSFDMNFLACGISYSNKTNSAMFGHWFMIN